MKPSEEFVAPYDGCFCAGYLGAGTCAYCIQLALIKRVQADARNSGLEEAVDAAIRAIGGKLQHQVESEIDHVYRKVITPAGKIAIVAVQDAIRALKTEPKGT